MLLLVVNYLLLSQINADLLTCENIWYQSSACEIPSNLSLVNQTANPRFQLQNFTKYSESHLWALLMSFYERKGITNWEDNTVPFFVTSNAFIANSYARVISGFLRDVVFNSSDFVYIVELGTGAGRFSHLLVHALAAMEDTLPIPSSRIKYVMTDFTAANFQAWTSHPQLQQLVAAGIVDFAIFDAAQDDELHLYHSNKVLKTGDVVNPMIIIANYLLDTLHHDLFRVSRQQLYEGLISVGSHSAYEPDPLDPEIISRMWNYFEYRPVDTNYYRDEKGEAPLLNDILKWYVDYYSRFDDGGTFLLPIGGIRAVRTLAALAHHKVMLICADKAFDDASSYIGKANPSFASYSVMVNYHALSLYFEQHGGFALHDEQVDASLKVSVFVMKSKTRKQVTRSSNLNFPTKTIKCAHFPTLCYNYEIHIVDFGPEDFYQAIVNTLKMQQIPQLVQVLAFLKLARWDASLFCEFVPHLQFLWPQAPATVISEFFANFDTIARTNFKLEKQKVAVFEIARFYAMAFQFRKAMEYFELAEVDMGPNAKLYFNVGKMHRIQAFHQEHLHLKQTYLERAMKYILKARALNASFILAKPEQEQLEKELEQVAYELDVKEYGERYLIKTEV